MSILLSRVVAQVESQNNAGAVRFEPNYTPSADGIQNAGLFASGAWMDRATAVNICMSSYGAYQIMGDNLYNEICFEDTIWDFSLNPSRQLMVFRKFLQLGGYSDDEFSSYSPSELDAFARFYNGSELYVTSLIKAYRSM